MWNEVLINYKRIQDKEREEKTIYYRYQLYLNMGERNELREK